MRSDLSTYTNITLFTLMNISVGCTQTTSNAPNKSDRDSPTHKVVMLSLLSRRSIPAAVMVRSFAKAADIPTKYNVLTIPALRDNFSRILFETADL